MLKREDKFTAGELQAGHAVRFTDAEGEDFPLAYEGVVLAADGGRLHVRLTDVRPIGVDRRLPESYPRPGEEVWALVSDISSRSGDGRD